MKRLFILFLYITFIFNKCICSCNWGEWTKVVQCEWIDNHCLNGYHRNCICDSKISIGSACNSPLQTNYIQTKPFVSNFYSNKGICYKSHCSFHSNWCQWESWSYWYPITNRTCQRLRSRKCCLSQPQIGYTSKKSINYGCFISTSEQNSSQIEEDIKFMICSPHTRWLKILLYVSISLGVLIIILLICRCTGSKFKNELKYSNTTIDIPLEIEVMQYEPTAPPPMTSFMEPTDSPLPVTSYSSTPPTYDETIRASFADTEMEIRRNEKKNFPDFEENTTIMNEETHNINFNNISPPSYTLYSRNPYLFLPSS